MKGQERTGKDSKGQEMTGKHRKLQGRTGNDRKGQERIVKDKNDRAGQEITGKDKKWQGMTSYLRTEASLSPALNSFRPRMASANRQPNAHTSAAVPGLDGSERDIQLRLYTNNLRSNIS